MSRCREQIITTYLIVRRWREEWASTAGRDGVRDVRNGVPRHSGRSRQDREGEMVLEENEREQG